jgi:hypothetical protein
MAASSGAVRKPGNLFFDQALFGEGGREKEGQKNIVPDRAFAFLLVSFAEAASGRFGFKKWDGRSASPLHGNPSGSQWKGRVEKLHSD